VIAYADLTFYTETFLGVSISAQDFPRLALRASEIIDQVTFDRAADVIDAGIDFDLIDKIKSAVCAVAEQIQTLVISGGGAGIKSESLGNHSVTYVDGASPTLTLDEQYYLTARTYLGSTGLMYRGI